MMKNAPLARAVPALLGVAFAIMAVTPSESADRRRKVSLPKATPVHWSVAGPDRAGLLPHSGIGHVVPRPQNEQFDAIAVEARSGADIDTHSWGFGHHQGSGRYCDIVVKRSGGNPTQDMTGSIGHAKSYQSGGGAGRKRVCSLQ